MTSAPNADRTAASAQRWLREVATVDFSSWPDRHKAKWLDQQMRRMVLQLPALWGCVAVVATVLLLLSLDFELPSCTAMCLPPTFVVAVCMPCWRFLGSLCFAVTAHHASKNRWAAADHVSQKEFPCFPAVTCGWLNAVPFEPHTEVAEYGVEHLWHGP